MGLRQKFEAVKLSMFDISKAQSALPEIEKGLKQYASLMERIRNVNVSQDRQFQKDYNSFFRVRQRADRFYAEYYQFMEDHKNDNELTFEATLRYLFEKTERVEASFSSKLLSVVNQKMPIWDKWVLKKAKSKTQKPPSGSLNRRTVLLSHRNLLHQIRSAKLKQEITRRVVFPTNESPRGQESQSSVPRLRQQSAVH